MSKIRGYSTSPMKASPACRPVIKYLWSIRVGHSAVFPTPSRDAHSKVETTARQTVTSTPPSR